MPLEGNAAVLYDVNDVPSIGAPGDAIADLSAVRIGGDDGTNFRALLTDNAGRQRMIGAAANGAAVAGDPVLIAGSDGPNARTIKTLADGSVVVSSAPLKAGTATLTNPTASTTSATILALNADRLGVLIHNDSNKAMFVKYGATASSSSFSVKIPARGSWEMPAPVYTGAIDAVWANGASGAARVTELEA